MIRSSFRNGVPIFEYYCDNPECPHWGGEYFATTADTALAMSDRGPHLCTGCAESETIPAPPPTTPAPTFGDDVGAPESTTAAE